MNLGGLNLLRSKLSGLQDDSQVPLTTIGEVLCPSKQDAAQRLKPQMATGAGMCGWGW